MKHKNATRHIVAIGGSTSKAGASAPLLIQYSLSLTKKKNPRILFLNTATGDAQSSELLNYKLCANLRCSPSHIGLFGRTPSDLAERVMTSDVIFVGGGNTKSMLAVWHEYGLDTFLLQAYEGGVVMTGSSAGGICWFQQCLTDSWADSYTTLGALGFLKGSCCPHYDGEAGRRETFHDKIKCNELMDGYALDEAAGIHFVDGVAHQAISALKGASAYRVSQHGDKIKEKRLKTLLLK